MQISDYIDDFTLIKGEFEVKKCKNPKDLPKLFYSEEKRLSFPPDGKIENSQIEYYLEINFRRNTVGFYKIIDLEFDGVIELHGSFSKTNSFLIKGYIELTRKFIDKISLDWPQFDIESVASKQNIKVHNFLNHLNFKKYGENGNYFNYKLSRT